MMKRFFSFMVLVLVLASTTAAVTLEWEPNGPDPEGYRLFRRLDGLDYDYSKPLVQMSGTRYQDTTTQPGETYFYVVRAYVGQNESSNSNEVSYTQPLPIGSPPGALVGFTLRKEGQTMYLTTDPVPGNPEKSDEIDYFEVEIDGQVIRSPGEMDETGTLIRLHHDMSGLSHGEHQARACGVNSWGEGPWTDFLSFTASSPGALSGFGLSED